MAPKTRVPSHPGEILQEKFLDSRGISQNALAKHIGVPHPMIWEICHGRRGISARTAIALGRALGPSAEYWARLQADYEVSQARRTAKGKVAARIAPMAAGRSERE